VALRLPPLSPPAPGLPPRLGCFAHNTWNEASWDWKVFWARDVGTLNPRTTRVACLAPKERPEHVPAGAPRVDEFASIARTVPARRERASAPGASHSVVSRSRTTAVTKEQVEWSHERQ